MSPRQLSTEVFGVSIVVTLPSGSKSFTSGAVTAHPPSMTITLNSIMDLSALTVFIVLAPG